MFTGFLLRRQREEDEDRRGVGVRDMEREGNERERWGELGELVREKEKIITLLPPPLSKKHTQKAMRNDDVQWRRSHLRIIRV